MRKTAGILLLCFGGAAGARAADAPVPLILSFSQQVVTVSAATPGGKVILFGVGREMSDSHPPAPRTVRRMQVLTDDDHDGILRYDLQRAIPRMAMWAAVDLTSGAHIAAPSPGFEPVRVSVTPDLVKNDNAGQLKKLEWPFAEMDLLVVRPGSGAWHLYASKYSGLDENAANQNALRIDVERMIPIGDSPAPPKQFKKDDVIALFDPRWMQFGIVEVNP